MEIVVKLTTGCNLRCVYCSEGDKPLVVLKKEYLYKLIDELPAFLDAHHDKKITLLWHGGEPMTVGTVYLQQVMDYAREKLQGYELSFQMQTNLTLLDEKWIELIKAYQIGVGVSVDGYQELHDANRFDKEGKPTFAMVTKNMDRLQEASIHFGTLMVLNTEKEIDVDKLYDFIKSRDLHMKIHPVIPCGRAAGHPHAREIYDRYVDIMETLYETAMVDLDFEGTIEPLEEMMRAILSDSHLGECSYNGSCGKNILCLFANGEMGFCGRAEQEKENLGFGNIKNVSLQDMYESAHAKTIRSRQDFLKSHSCGRCSEWNLCRGGCSFEALNAFGTLEARYPNCEGRRRLIQYLKTKGLELLKKRLIANREKYRIIIKSRKKMLKDLENG